MKNINLFASLLFCILSGFQLNSQSIIYVKNDASGSNDGTDWTNAYTSLTTALENAEPYDTLWIAEGTYKPAASARDSSFILGDTIALYGGFAGTETSLDERDWENHPTILSGDLGVIDDSTDNSYNVIIGANHTTIDGFVISDANANGNESGVNDMGGGIRNSDVDNMIVRNCIFNNNTAKAGGAIVNYYCEEQITIENCTFNNNASGEGGAIGNYNCPKVKIKYCLFYDNYTIDAYGGTEYGGAIYNWHGATKPDISYCTFFNNEASCGGAIHDRYGKSCVKNSIFWGNKPQDVCQTESSSLDISYSCIIQSGYFDKNNNISTYPDFTDTTNLDFSLSASSPCIDTGNPASPYDPDGTIADMGKFPYDHNHANDASITEIENPAGIIDTGNNSVEVTLANYGSNTIFGADIYWEVDGVPQTTYSWVGTLAKGESETGINIGSYSFPNDTSIIKIWVVIGADEYHLNDTVTSSVIATTFSSGTYTIGPSGDFSTLTDAVDSLTNSNGITGPVIFNIASGTYNEQISIPQIPGTSADNTITFQSESGDSTDVIIVYSSTIADDNYTVQLDGADYFAFKNVTIQATGTEYATAIEYTNNAKYNLISNCNIIGMPGVSALVTMNRDTGNIIQNNVLQNGAEGIYLDGSALYIPGFECNNNVFSGQSSYGIRLEYPRSPVIKNNYFVSDSMITGISIVINKIDFICSNNRFFLNNGGNAINIYYGDFKSEFTSLISNNIISINAVNPSKGIILDHTDNLNLQIYHNTVLIKGNNSNSYAYYTEYAYGYFDLKNNIFSNQAYGKVYRYDVVSESDYNSFYSNGEYLNYYNADLAAWQTASGQDLHSVYQRPVFNNQSDLEALNPVFNNSGIYSDDVPTDITGATRNPSTPDMGAYEFTPVATPLSGNFSIGGSTPDYETINEAVDDLIINGIDGPVVFTLENDTFAEQVSIPEISGASETNTIKFESGVDTSTIYFTIQNPTHNYAIRLDGADFCTFNKLNIITVGTDQNTIRIENRATNNFITNNYISNIGSTGGGYLIYSPTSIDSNNVISSNILENSRNGIRLTGNTDSTLEAGTQILNNTINNMVYYHIAAEYQKSINISGNIVSQSTNSIASIGIRLANSDSGLIANNMINFTDIANAPVGITIENSNQQKIYYNTIRINATYNSSIALNVNGEDIDVKNNILVNDGYGYAITCADSTSFSSDFNVFYSDYRYAMWLGSDVYTFEAWQDSSKDDQHSISYFPEFVSGSDLHTNDPHLNYIGTPLAEVTVDIDGEARDLTHPDIGADEILMGVPLAGEYFIGPTHEFKTFNEAVDSISQVGVIDSVIFTVDPGIYNEQFVIPEIPVASLDKSITFRSVTADSTDVQITFQPSDTNFYTILLDSADYIRFENISIQNTDSDSRVIIFRGGAENNIISNCHIYSPSTEHSLVFSDDDNDNNNQFNNNYFLNGGFGIHFYGIEGDNEEGTVIENNTFINQYSVSIKLENQSGSIISSNYIRRDTINNQYYAMLLENSDNLSVINNMISLEAVSSSTIAGIFPWTVSASGFFHNTVNIYGNGSGTNCRAFNIQDCSFNGVNLQNNILVNTSDGIVIYTNNTSSLVSDYNDLYATGAIITATSANTYNNFADWQAVGYDANSFNIDPLFESDSNLHISSVLLNQAGTYIEDINTDFDGDARDSIPDIGADEFNICMLNGIYTIGTTDEDFETISEAIDTFCRCSVDGDVIFNISPGDYNEQLLLTSEKMLNIPSDYSVTFQSSTGDSSDVIVYYNAQSSDDNYILKINGIDHLNFNALTFETRSNNFSRLIDLTGGGSDISFTNNYFVGEVTESDSTEKSIIYKEGTEYSSALIFENNRIVNGTYGVLLDYGEYNSEDSLIIIENNNFENQYKGGISLSYLKNVSINSNTITSNNYNTYYGIFGTQCENNFTVSNNKIFIGGSQEDVIGIYMNSFSGQPGKNIISNNYIYISTINNLQGGIKIYVADSLDIVFNTIMNNGNYSSYTLNAQYIFETNILNNIFVNNENNSNSLVSLSDVSGAINVDYNIYAFRQGMTGSIADFEAWLNTTSYDDHSYFAKIDFENDSSYITHSPFANNSGTPISGIDIDIEGNARNITTPDIGAYEFENSVYSLGDDVIACINGSKIIDAGIGYDSYLWSVDSTGSKVTINRDMFQADTSTISCEVTLGSENYIDSVKVIFTGPVAVISGSTDICYDDMFELYASGGINSQWFLGYIVTGDTLNANANFTDPQEIILTVEDEYGCTDDDTVIIEPLLRPSQPSIGESYEGSIVTLTAYYDDGLTTNIIWYFNGEEYSEGVPSITPSENGDYSVIVYNNYCASEESSIITGLITNENPEINVFPNPTNKYLYVEFKNNDDYYIELFNIDGKKVVINQKIPEFNNNMIEIDVSKLSKGIYILKIVNQKELNIRYIFVK